jgi:hypothetical protein
VEVVAVHAWEPGTAMAPYAPVSARLMAAQRRERAAEVLSTTVRAGFGPHTDPCMHAVLVEGPPAHVLLRRARGALLLALGHRPHEQCAVPAVGPVGRACLRHSTVPVVMVPDPEQPEARPTTREAPGRLRCVTT